VKGILVEFAFALVLATAFAGWVQPQPGGVFRECLWTKAGGDAGGSLRVGGKVGYGDGPIALPHQFDLEHAVRAEIVLEKLLCHDSTRGFAISVNSNAELLALLAHERQAAPLHPSGAKKMNQTP
jgi:hypothetical protein